MIHSNSEGVASSKSTTKPKYLAIANGKSTEAWKTWVDCVRSSLSFFQSCRVSAGVVGFFLAIFFNLFLVFWVFLVLKPDFKGKFASKPHLSQVLKQIHLKNPIFWSQTSQNLSFQQVEPSPIFSRNFHFFEKITTFCRIFFWKNSCIPKIRGTPAQFSRNSFESFLRAHPRHLKKKKTKIEANSLWFRLFLCFSGSPCLLSLSFLLLVPLSLPFLPVFLSF